MEPEGSESEAGSASKTRKPSRNKLACSIACLDGVNFNINIEKNAPGKSLIEKICLHLNVEEKEYFGLLYVDLKTGLKRWLETQKPIKKQLHGSEANFEFAVKFFEPNPEELKNDYTRYLMALQIREEIATGGLPCSFSAQALLGSYVIQSEFGDYDPLQHGQDYLDGLVFAPDQSAELILKIKELHKTHKGLTPMESDLQYLEYARKLTLYGVDLHEARDSEGAEIHVGVSFAGIAIYKDQIRQNKFSWPTIDEVKYKGRNFFVKIKPGEYQAFISTVVFKTPNDRATKELYKSVVEHHTFYRLREPDSPKGGTLPRLHSRFRYSDRTLFQLRQGAYNSLPRPSTLTRRWSDRQSERKRPAARSGEDPEGLEPKIRRDEVPVTSAEPEDTMGEEERKRYRQHLAAKLGVKSGDEKEKPMDVVFTFGACGRNADDVFEKEKDMVSGFLETIKVADTYYGVIEYGEQKANIMARLGDFRNKERLNQYINTIPRSGEGRAIDKALEKARELLLENGRHDARKALVIFANGKSSARLAELTKEAKPLHDAGVKIIAVGIGDDIDDEELNSIATNKILAQPYDEPAPLGHLLAHEVSEAPSKELVDVTFVMGASGNEGDAAFEKEKEIINSFVDLLKSNDTQMAVVNYGENGSNVDVKLGQFKDKEDFKSCVDKQERQGEGKALDKALDDTDKVLKETGRPGVRKAVVVFANGKTGAEIAELAKQARALHGDDVKIVAVGLGDDVSEEELKAVANAGVILAKRDQDSDAIAQNVAKQLDMLSDAAEDAVDIAFAFGASGPDADAVFKKEKEMINVFIDSLKVHDTEYGVIEYSSEARVHASFGQFSRKERLKAQVSGIERRGEGVGIDKALTSAYDLLVKNGRRGARKVLIVFTSGKANVGVYELRAGAKALQDVGVKIVAVAIGNNVDEDQLKEISSDEHVIHSQLTGDSAAIIQLISDDVVSAELTGEAVDIIFAVGSAGVEAEMVFEKEKEMVYAFVNSVDTANVRYALIEYAENATLQADFNEHKEKYDFKEFVDSVRRIGEGLGLDKALQRAATVFENSGRDNAKRVLVLFTNAQSQARTQDLQKHSRELQEVGVKVVVVAIGADVSEEELSNIHGEPVVRAQPHDDVNAIVKGVASDVLATEPDVAHVPLLGPKIKLDVVFAIGAAGRDANDVFDKEKEIVNSFIDNLKENDSQFAIIEFGHKASVKSKFGDERDAGKLKESVSGIQRSGDGKGLDKALEQAVQIFHNEARPASNRVLIVMTNAKSNARTHDLQKHAQSLTAAGVKVQVVAVGNDVNEEELLEVTSNELPLLRVQPYEEPQAVIGNSAWIVGEKQDEYLDIVFAFGSFGETAEEIFEKEKQLINSFVDSIQKRDTHYGVIEIGPRAKVCSKIGQYRDHVRLKRHLNLIRRSGDATGLDHALEVAANMFENQARANSKRVLVVFTNGKSGAQAPELKQNSERLTKSNVDVIMVAIGDDVDDDECQYVTCGSHPIINIAPEQNPRAVVYSIVGELEEAKSIEPVDIVFVLGAAGEGADTVYNKNKQIISKFIEANKVPYTMYSLVDYGGKAIVRSKFGDNKHHAVLLDQIEDLERPGEGKALDKALEQSVNLLETQGRHGAKKRVIVFANGKSGANPNHLKKCATLLEDSNVKVVTVAVGDDINMDELRHINPDEEAIVKVDTLEEPESAVFAVAHQVQEPCKPKFDIIFAFGAMGNSADMVYLKEKEMIGSFIDSFEFGDYRYGVVEYGTKASVKAKFDDVHGKEKMKEFVNNIHRSGEGKALDKALEQSCELFKKHGRHSARKVLIVFTNGKSSARANELKKHAQTLTDLNTKLIVVAIGDDVSVEELLEVTSSEESIVRTQPEDDHEALFASIVRFNIEERPVTDVDVMFALGASGHHGDEMFDKEKDFVNGFIDSSKHGNMDYAMIQYIDPLTVHFRFKDFEDKEKVKDKILSIQRGGDGSSMAEGLRKANELFTNESRPNSHKVLIVMMNGPLGGRAGELKAGAKALQKIGVKVITVAIGDEVDHDELRQLSCDEENVIHVKANEDVGSVAYVITHQAVKGTPVHEEVIKEERFSRQVFLQPRIRLVIRPSMVAAERRRKEEEDEKKRLEEQEELRRQEEERLRLEEKKRIEQERLREMELERQRELREEEERLERERLELEQLEREAMELERKQKEEEEERKRKEIEEQMEKDKELEEELVMMPFAVATPVTEDVKKAHRRTLDLEESFAEKASFLRVSESGTPEQDNEPQIIITETPKNVTTETVTKEEITSTVYVNPANLQDDVLYNRDNTPEIRYSLKTDLNLDYEQGERGFVRDQIRNQETEIKRRSTHDPSLQSSLDSMLKSTTVATLELTPDDVFPPPPPEEMSSPPPEEISSPPPEEISSPPSEIPNVETRTVIYEPNPPSHISTYQMQGDPVVVTRRVKIDTTPVSQTTKTTHVVRHTSTPAEVVTKTITIEGDGEPLTAEELAEIMSMSGTETTTVTNSSYQRVERVQKVEQVVTSKQFVQSGQSFIVETGDADADAAIMKALEDARKQDPNVKVAEVTITKQETEDDD